MKWRQIDPLEVTFIAQMAAYPQMWSKLAETEAAQLLREFLARRNNVPTLDTPPSGADLIIFNHWLRRPRNKGCLPPDTTG